MAPGLLTLAGIEDFLPELLFFIVFIVLPILARRRESARSDEERKRRREHRTPPVAQVDAPVDAPGAAQEPGEWLREVFGIDVAQPQVVEEVRESESPPIPAADSGSHVVESVFDEEEWVEFAQEPEAAGSEPAPAPTVADEAAFGSLDVDLPSTDFGQEPHAGQLGSDLPSEHFGAPLGGGDLEPVEPVAGRTRRTTDWRRALVLAEILGPPASERDPSDPSGGAGFLAGPSGLR